jgi:hypothetical protein
LFSNNKKPAPPEDRLWELTGTNILKTKYT